MGDFQIKVRIGVCCWGLTFGRDVDGRDVDIRDVDRRDVDGTRI
jgi:hypothetical protein